MELAKKMTTTKKQIIEKEIMTKKEIEEFESSACEWRDHIIEKDIMDQYDSIEECKIKIKILRTIQSQRKKDGGW